MDEPGTASARGALVGRVINGYQVIGLIGRGGMGEVYLARHQALGLLRAIKVLRDDVKADATTAARFRREALVLTRLRHAGIVEVVDFGELDTGSPFLCLEHIAGRTLDQHVRARGRLALAEAIPVLIQLATVLAYAHGEGVVHRDLKTSNVLLRDGDPAQVKVIDFALARLLSPERLTRLTTERHVLGSPDYLAPEQATAAPDVTSAVDIYALAGIAYKLLSGRTVFGDRTVLALIRAHADETPARLATRVALPGPLDDLLFACLAKDPAQRPGAAEVAARLVELGDDVGRGAAAWVGPSSRGAVAATESTVSGPPLPVTWTTPPDPAEAAPRAVDRLFEAAPDDDPVARQLLAVVAEVAAELDGFPDVAAPHAAVDRLQREIQSLEVQLAVVDAEIADGAGGRAALEQRQWALRVRADVLRHRLHVAQRALVEAVERARDAAPAELRDLYVELDELIARARGLADRRAEPPE